MEKLISEIYSIIKDYREEDRVMSENRIRQWVNQFDEGDRVFLLEEMKNILSKRYISKDSAIDLLT